MADLTSEQKIIRDYKFLMTELFQILPFVDNIESSTDTLKLLWKQKFTKHCMDRGEAGRNRNVYLAKFIECLKCNKFYGPFLSIPPAGELPQWPTPRKPFKRTAFVDKHKIDTDGEPFRYHFARKSLDYGAGICVCIGLTFVQPQFDEDDVVRGTEAWEKMGRYGVPHPLQQ